MLSTQKRRRSMVSTLKIAPTPVRPTPMRFHGLLGAEFLKYHWVYDNRWSQNSHIEELAGMTDLLSRRLFFERRAARARRQRLLQSYQTLKKECQSGRIKLKSMQSGGQNDVRITLTNNKNLQRLYSNMPTDMVVDSINSKTFLMRKERDNLLYRLKKLKEEYKTKLIELSHVEDRLKYKEEATHVEELKIKEFHKKIKNSEIRLGAIKTINGAYKKIIQVLTHDAIFYEPILRSLNDDIENQQKFIQHVIYMGMPAIDHFKTVNNKYRKMLEMSRRDARARLAYLKENFYAKDETNAKKTELPNVGHKNLYDPIINAARYLRNTKSMEILKATLHNIEEIIKKVKAATLCSLAKEIYPALRGQVKFNFNLFRTIGNDSERLSVFDEKKKRAEVLELVLINNLTEEEINRHQHIENLKIAIEAEDKFEEETLEYMKERAKLFVVLRYFLWNVYDIIKDVNHTQRKSIIKYKTSYLKLPLLKFDMLTLRAYPPDEFEGSIDVIFRNVKMKIRKLMKAYTSELPPRDIEQCHQIFSQMHMLSLRRNSRGGDVDDLPKNVSDDDMPLHYKLATVVPTYKQVKQASARFLESRH